MRFRYAWTIGSSLVFGLLASPPAFAQQSINLSAGYFAVRGEDARIDGDVLVENRSLFLFDIRDFDTASLGIEWLLPIGDFLEAGAGLHFTTRGVNTVYNNFVRPNDAEIDQELKLRIVPLSATIRILPLGRHAAFQPYVGGGIGIHFWRYAETGDFIDFTLPGRPVFRESYVATGTSVGPVAIFGAKVPLGNVTIGGEVRYQKADGDLDEGDFLAPKIDLGGFHYMGTVGIRF